MAAFNEATKWLNQACYINGEWVSSSENIEVQNPASKKVIGTVPKLISIQINEAIDSVVVVFDDWRKQEGINEPS